MNVQLLCNSSWSMIHVHCFTALYFIEEKLNLNTFYPGCSLYSLYLISAKMIELFFILLWNQTNVELMQTSNWKWFFFLIYDFSINKYVQRIPTISISLLSICWNEMISLSFQENLFRYSQERDSLSVDFNDINIGSVNFQFPNGIVSPNSKFRSLTNDWTLG